MNKDNLTKEYTNGTVTIVWKSGLCSHSGVCVANLPSVFKPRDQPWITMGDVDDATIIETVRKCPSGALSIKQ